MKRLTIIALFLIMAGAMGKEIQKQFDAKKEVRIKTVSGDVILKQGSAGKIDVNLIVETDPEDAMMPRFEERENRLYIEEEWRGSSRRSRVLWTITVPPGTEIDFSTASGDLEADNLELILEASTASGDISLQDARGEFDISTASGDVELYRVSGELDISTASGDVDATRLEGLIEVSTASGDIDVENSKGEFDLSCASGDMDISDIILEAPASFSAASGDVEVSLDASSDYDMYLSTASGDIILDYQNHKIKGSFIFTARKDRGRIISSIGFETEDEFEKYDRIYMKKTFTRGGKAPVIRLETASGRAVLK